MHGHDDFAFEPSPGIPAPLPVGERVLWQGSPDWRTLARRVFHVPGVALWFALIGAFEVLWTLTHGEPFAAALPGLGTTALLGAAACTILALLAWLNGRVTIYTVTTRRVLIRFGVALQVTMNLPFVEVLEANVRVGRGGVGDIPLALRDTSRVGYLVLWPHVRPWRFARPEPMLRAVPDAGRVAGLLGAAMGEALDGVPLGDVPLSAIEGAREPADPPPGVGANAPSDGASSAAPVVAARRDGVPLAVGVARAS